MKTWKYGIIGIFAILALAFAFIACNKGKNDPQEKPEYRESEIIFSFLDMGGNPVNGKKARIEGTMLEADWNTAKATAQTKIESTQHNGTTVVKTRFRNMFADDQNTTIIFDPNAGNGKLEVKVDEWRNLYINPAALSGITDADFIGAIDAMRAAEEPYVA